MRVTSLLSLLVRTARLAVRAEWLELEYGRNRADLGGHVGQQGLGSRRCGSDGSGGAFDGDEDGRATHVL